MFTHRKKQENIYDCPTERMPSMVKINTPLPPTLPIMKPYFTLEDKYNGPTEIRPVVRRSRDTTPLPPTRPIYPLPLDESNRPFLKVKAGGPTGILAYSAAHKYLEVMKTYPSVIALSERRYWEFGRLMHELVLPMYHIRLPYVLDPMAGQDFDVMIRGEVVVCSF